MRVPRCHVDAPLAAGTTLELPDATAHHLTRVLRLPQGAAITLFNGFDDAALEFPATLTAVSKRGATAALAAAVPTCAESPLHVTLIQALAKGDRVDLAIQKSVELGVGQIILATTARSNVKLSGDRLAKKLAHWQGVAISAAEQSGRTRVPQVSAHADWASALVACDAACNAARANSAATGPRLVLHPPDADDGATESLAEHLRKAADTRTAACAVGPEGGFTAEEIDAARRSGFCPIQLGPRVLRTETAGPAMLAILQSLHGDLGGDLDGSQN